MFVVSQFCLISPIRMCRNRLLLCYLTTEMLLHRLTGPANCRLDILGRHGMAVAVHHNCVSLEHVQAKLEDATKQPLHKAFVRSASSPGI